MSILSACLKVVKVKWIESISLIGLVCFILIFARMIYVTRPNAYGSSVVPSLATYTLGDRVATLEAQAVRFENRLGTLEWYIYPAGTSWISPTATVIIETIPPTNTLRPTQTPNWSATQTADWNDISTLVATITRTETPRPTNTRQLPPTPSLEPTATAEEWPTLRPGECEANGTFVPDYYINTRSGPSTNSTIVSVAKPKDVLQICFETVWFDGTYQWIQIAGYPIEWIAIEKDGQKWGILTIR